VSTGEHFEKNPWEHDDPWIQEAQRPKNYIFFSIDVINSTLLKAVIVEETKSKALWVKHISQFIAEAGNILSRTVEKVLENKCSGRGRDVIVHTGRGCIPGDPEQYISGWWNR